MRPGVNATWTRNTTAPAPLATTMAVPATPPTTRAAPLVGHALRPPRPTVSLDARPVLIPILSSVICFPIVAFAVICALRYRALRLRRKEHMRRLRGGGWWASRKPRKKRSVSRWSLLRFLNKEERNEERCAGESGGMKSGGMRAARLEIPGREKPSLFSRDSSSGDTSSRPPGQEDERRTQTRVPSSSSDDEDDDDFTSDIVAGGRPLASSTGSRRGSINHVKFGAAAAILHVPGVPSPRSGSPRSGSPRSGSVTFFEEPSFIHDVVNDYEDDADDEDDLETTGDGR